MAPLTAAIRRLACALAGGKAAGCGPVLHPVHLGLACAAAVISAASVGVLVLLAP